ncbi:MAG: hypothetical protein JWN67_2153 [Actinomycetia bacterium]|nr:hypothetical protein [Actinomycetes bacterium]
MSLQRFEGTSIEAVLEEARAQVGAGVRIVEANRLRRGGIGGFFAKERFEVAVEVTEMSAPASAKARRVFPTGTDPVLALADEVSDGELASSLSTEQDAFAELLGRIARDVQDDVAVAASSPMSPAPVAHHLPELSTPPPSSSSALGLLGLPSAIVPTGEDTATGLLRALSALPVAGPVPRAAGDVVAVVGERHAALALARAIATELGLAHDEVVLASEHDDGEDLPLGCLLPTLPAVADERCSARWRRRPSIVVVDVPVRPGASTFGRRALEALEPTATWGAVMAASKPEDVRAWSDSLGGLDAVAVDGLDDTSTPASILGTGIPVARLDGRPASPALWTALLMERLAA